MGITYDEVARVAIATAKVLKKQPIESVNEWGKFVNEVRQALEFKH